MTPGRVWAFHAHWFDSYVRAAQECPGWHRIQRGTRKNIDPACQGAQTVFCTPHTPRIRHAELIPMGLQHSPHYVVHHLPDDELTSSVSWPAPRYCIGYLNSLGGFFLQFISIPTICSQWFWLSTSTVACFPFVRFISMIAVLNSCCTVQNRLLCI